MKAFFKRRMAAALNRASSFIMNRRYQQACVDARTALPRYLPRVAGYLGTQRVEKGLYHDHTDSKLLELAFMLERLAPRTILECGSGATTSVFAEYALSRPGTVLVTLDNGKEYLEQTQARLDAAVRDVPIFVHTERVVAGAAGQETCWYSPIYLDHFAERRVDLCYVDGPYNVSPTVPTWHMPCVDVIKLLEAGVQVRNILFDNRFSSVRYLRDSVHGLRYDSEQNPSLVSERGESWYVAPAQHHSRFWLRGAQ